MINRITLREILAWIALAIAFVLLSVSVSFAQSRSVRIENEDGKVHLRISSTENGKTVKTDTTFTMDDDTDIENIINQLIGDEPASLAKNDNGKSDRVKRKKLIVNLDMPEFTDEEKKKIQNDIKESLKDVHVTIHELKKSLKNIHIDIDSELKVDEDDEKGDFKFNFDIPEIDIHSLEDCVNNSYSYSYSFNHNGEADSLDDGEHFIVMGEGDESPPVLEKVITKNGKQLFIYKRTLSQGKKDKEESDVKEENKTGQPDFKSISCYPNPGNGKFTLSFRSEASNDFLIKILDGNSKEVYRETLDDFQGDYTKEIDISDKSKGTYLLKIMQGKKSYTLKIVVN